MRTMRIAFGAAVAALTTLALATPASAAAVTINLKSEHTQQTAAGFNGGKTCTGPFDSLPDDVDGWHFVLPASSGEDFLSATLTFTAPSGTVTATVTGTEAAPSFSAVPGSAWEGYIDNAGAADKHVYLITEAGWTLTGGTASVEGGVEGQPFNLSHTCAGTPDNSTPSPDPEESESPDPDPTTPGASPSTPGGNLPKTGFPVAGVAVAGLVMLVGGAALMAVRRRRDIVDHA